MSLSGTEISNFRYFSNPSRFLKILQFPVDSISFLTEICNALLNPDKHEPKLVALFIKVNFCSMFVFAQMVLRALPRPQHTPWCRSLPAPRRCSTCLHTANTNALMHYNTC